VVTSAEVDELVDAYRVACSIARLVPRPELLALRSEPKATVGDDEEEQGSWRI